MILRFWNSMVNRLMIKSIRTRVEFCSRHTDNQSLIMPSVIQCRCLHPTNNRAFLRDYKLSNICPSSIHNSTKCRCRPLVKIIWASRNINNRCLVGLKISPNPFRETTKCRHTPANLTLKPRIICKFTHNSTNLTSIQTTKPKVYPITQCPLCRRTLATQVTVS